MRRGAALAACAVLVAIAAGCGDANDADRGAGAGDASRPARPVALTDAEARTLVVRTARRLRFAPIAEDLADLVRRGHHLAAADTADGADGAGEPGSTRGGGLPDLPADVEWPTAPDGAGRPEPLTFVGQVRLEDLDPSSWEGPTTGLLSFFYAAITRPGEDTDEIARVLLLPTDDLAPRERPADRRDRDDGFPLHPTTPLPPVAWRAAPEVSIPWFPADALVPLRIGFGSAEARIERYFDLLDALFVAQGFTAGTVDAGDPPTLGSAGLGGWPVIAQTDILDGIGLPGGEPWPDREALLDVGFGDGGLVFIVSREDLRAGRFDRVEAYAS